MNCLTEWYEQLPLFVKMEFAADVLETVSIRYYGADEDFIEWSAHELRREAQAVKLEELEESDA